MQLKKPKIAANDRIFSLSSTTSPAVKNYIKKKIASLSVWQNA
jgi:hypothetical protein